MLPVFSIDDGGTFSRSSEAELVLLLIVVAGLFVRLSEISVFGSDAAATGGILPQQYKELDQTDAYIMHWQQVSHEQKSARAKIAVLLARLLLLFAFSASVLNGARPYTFVLVQSIAREILFKFSTPLNSESSPISL